MSETLSKQFNAHIGSRVSYRLTKEGYFDKTGSVVITEDGQVIDLTDTDFIPYDSRIQVVYNPQEKATVTINKNYNLVGEDVTVTDEGIASGFSDTSWILVDNKYKVWNSTCYVAFTTPSVIGIESIIHATKFFTLETNASDSSLHGYGYDQGKNLITYPIEPNTKYYVKVAVTSNRVKSYYIHDDTTTEWTEMGSFYDPSITITDDTLEYRIGQKSTSTDRAFSGTIDLLHTYITDNNDSNEDESNILYRPFSINVDSSDLICAPSTTLISSYKTQNNGAISYYTIADETITVDNVHYAEGLTYKKRNELKNIHDVPEEYDVANFTNIGTVSILNHVASDFDMDDFLTLGENGQFNMYAAYASNWEWNFKFEVNSKGLNGQASGNQEIFGQGLGWECGCGINGSNQVYLSINSTSGSSGDGRKFLTSPTALEYDKIYWVKCEFTGTAYKLYLSTDGINYTKEAEVIYSAKLNAIKSNYRIGGNYNSDQYYSYPFHGKIYLDECYILVNRKVWWKAYESIDVKTLRNKHKNVSQRALNLTLTNSTSLTYNRISGFNGNNYAYIPVRFDPGNNPWEIDFKMKSSGDFTSNVTYFFGSRNEDNGLLIGTASNGRLLIWLSSNGTSWDIANGSYYNSVIPANDSIYYYKLRFTGTAYELVVSTDNSSWITAASINSSTPIHPTILYFGSPWDKDTRYLRPNGYFDLSETKILINNQIWFTPQIIYVPEDEQTKTPNFNIHGGPDVTYTQVSNFSTENYLQLLEPFAPGGQSWEMQFKFKTPASDTASGWYSIAGYMDMAEGYNLHISGGKIKNEFSSTGTSWNIGDIIGESLNDNTIYWVRTGWKNNTYYLDLSEDGTTWRSQGTISSSEVIHAGTNCQYIGTHVNGSAWKYFRGTIYFEDSFIKINDEIAWIPYIENNAIRMFKILGTPNITNLNIASGFSNSSSLVYLNQLKDFDTFEIRAKITTSDNITTNQIFFCTTEQPKCPVALNVCNSHFRLYLTSDITNSWNIAEAVDSTYTVLPNTTYYVKLVYNGSNYVFSYSLDDITYNTGITIDNSTKIAPFTPTMGSWAKDATTITSFFRGSIDLNYYSITVNNKLWWKAIVTEEDDLDFYQPILSADGTVAGDYFASRASSILNSNNEAWRAFDGVPCDSESSDYWHSASGHPAWIEWYNPYPIAISNIEIQNRHDHGSYINNYTIQYSDDGTNYIYCKSGTSPSQSALAYWNIPIEEEYGHKYWRLVSNSSSGSNSDYTAVALVTITGKIKPTNINEEHEEIDPLENDDKNYYAFGNLQINNGIASGFSSDNILALPKTFIAKPNDTFDIYVKFKTPSTLSGTLNLFGLSEPLLVRTYNTYLRLSFLQGTSWSNYDLWTLSTNTTYTVRCYYSSSTLYVYLYNSAGTLLNSTSYSIPNFLRFNWYKVFFFGSQENSEFWTSSIDLNGSYIKVNGNYWWKPFNEETPTEEVLKTKYIVQTPVKETDLTTYNNYKVVGSLTYNDGIYSGFSSSSYIDMNVGINEVSSDFITKINIHSLHSLPNDVFTAVSTNGAGTFGFSQEGKLGRYDVNNSAWTYGTTAYPLNTWIWVRQTYKDNSYKLYALLDNNYTLDTLPDISEWNLEYTMNTNKLYFKHMVRFGNSDDSNNGEYLDADFDFSQTKIIIDDKEIPLQIREYRNYSYGNSNGKFNISNKMASYFDGNTAGYINANTLGRFNGTKPWTIQVKFNLTSTANTYQCLFNIAGKICIYARSNGVFYIWLANNNGNSIIDGEYGSWTTDAWYWIRLIWTGSYYECYTSTNGSQFYRIMVHDTGQVIETFNTNNIFGSQYSSGGAYVIAPGLIDLNETYIIQDNKVVWSPYPNKKFEASEFKGFYVPEFIYTGNEMQVNAYRNILTSGDGETLLGEQPSQEEDVQTTMLIASDIDIGANNETVFTYNSNDEMFAPEGYCKIKFAANVEDYNITVTANDTVYTNPNRLYVKTGTVLSYKATKYGYMDLEDSDIEITQDETIELFFDKKEFKFSIDTTKVSDGTTSTDTTYILPLIENEDFTKLHDDLSINWGDNTTTLLRYTADWTQTNLTHTYPRAGQYQITISTKSGYMPRFDGYQYSGTNSNAYKVISIDSPLLKLTYSLCLFRYLRNLEKIPHDLFKYNSHITNLTDAFYYCIRLKSIPEDLLKPCRNLTTIPEAFSHCTALTSIPKDLFKYNTKLSYMGWIFAYDTAITNIPEDLFKYNINASSFEHTFQNTYIRTIPTDLFKYNLAVTSFYYTFSGCPYLSTVPDCLFETNIIATNFSYCFSNCYRLTINPNMFGYDLTARFNKLQTAGSISFTGTFLRQYFYATDPGTAPEIWKLEPKNIHRQSLSISGGYCFGYTTRSPSYYVVANINNFGNRNLTNFWDIPINWGGLSNTNLTIDVELANE